MPLHSAGQRIDFVRRTARSDAHRGALLGDEVVELVHGLGL
jgi:hypothetical protein